MALGAVTGFQSCHPAASILQGLWVSCSHVCTDKDKSHDIHFYWHCCKSTYRNLLYKYKVLYRGLTTPAFTGESSAMIFVFAQLYYLTIVTRHVTVWIRHVVANMESCCCWQSSWFCVEVLKKYCFRVSLSTVVLFPSVVQSSKCITVSVESLLFVVSTAVAWRQSLFTKQLIVCRQSCYGRGCCSLGKSAAYFPVN